MTATKHSGYSEFQNYIQYNPIQQQLLLYSNCRNENKSHIKCYCSKLQERQLREFTA